MSSMGVFILLGLVAMFAPTVQSTTQDWSYNGNTGPEFWAAKFEQCGGINQSPINIDTERTIYDSDLVPFHIENFNIPSKKEGLPHFNMTNNGHSASTSVKSDNMRVSGGGLDGVFKTTEFHFHWGAYEDMGSEHSVDDVKFPLEMHIVNYDDKYDSLTEAATQPDGLAVLGFFFELTDHDNVDFTPLEDALGRVTTSGEFAQVVGFCLGSLLPRDMSRYWRYSGSLTTPGCFESVKWTLFETPIKISTNQFNLLRSILHPVGKNSSPSSLINYWRPLQQLNGRNVYRSFDNKHRQGSR